METKDTGIRFERLTQIMENISKKVDELEQSSKEIMQKVDALQGGRIVQMEKELAVLIERVGVLSKIAYGLVGAALLSILGAVLQLVMGH